MEEGLSELAANAAASAVGKLLDGGALHLLDADGEILAELGFNSPAFNSPSDGSMKSYPLTPDESAKGDGNAKWYQMLSRGGAPVLTGRVVGPNDRTAKNPLRLNTVEIRKGAEVSLDEFFYTARKS